MSLYYADTSAVIKLLLERRTPRRWRRSMTPMRTANGSVLLRIEVIRAVARAMPALISDARDLLFAFSSIAMDDDTVEVAMHEPDRSLGSLHAIHLATTSAHNCPLTWTVGERILKVVADTAFEGPAPGHHSHTGPCPRLPAKEADVADAFAETDEGEMERLTTEWLAHVSVVQPRSADSPALPTEAFSTSCEEDPGWSYSDVRRQIDDQLSWGYAERSRHSRGNKTGAGSLDPLETIALALEPVDCLRMAAEYIQTLAIEIFEAKHRIAELERHVAET